MERELKQIKSQIGEKYNRLFDKERFPISYNELEEMGKRENWSRELNEKAEKAIFIDGEIREIKNSEERVFLYWGSALAIGIMGYSFGKSFEK